MYFCAYAILQVIIALKYNIFHTPMLSVIHICTNSYTVVVRINRYVYCFTIVCIPSILAINKNIIWCPCPFILFLLKTSVLSAKLHSLKYILSLLCNEGNLFLLYN